MIYGTFQTFELYANKLKGMGEFPCEVKPRAAVLNLTRFL